MVNTGSVISIGSSSPEKLQHQLTLKKKRPVYEQIVDLRECDTSPSPSQQSKKEAGSTPIKTTDEMAGCIAPQHFRPPMNPANRPVYVEGQELEGPHKGSGIDEEYGHYPMYFATADPEWYSQPDLRDQIPEYVALDDAMVYIVVKLFSAKERSEKWGLDFNKQGHIQGARQHAGLPFTIEYRGNRYYPIYRKYYALSGDHESGRSPELLSQSAGKAADSPTNFSFGAIKVLKIYQKNTHLLDVVRRI